MKEDGGQTMARFKRGHASPKRERGSGDVTALSSSPAQPASESAARNVVVVIPAYNAADTVVGVLRQLPPWLSMIVVVDDGSSDATAERVRECATEDDRITLVRHSANRGLSAAMATGFACALDAEADYIVKMDSDGQMRAEDLPKLLEPLIAGRADYAKGNRFRDFATLRQMPLVRLVGNVVLSFAAKAATGYWNLFDPTNGFVAIRADVLRQIHYDKLQGYFIFETAMLAELYLLGAVVEDVPMKAHYGKETSHLSIARAGVTYPARLLWMFVRRIFLRYFLMDFTMASVFLLSGLPMVATGAVYGVHHWWRYSQLGIGAPTGTVVLPAMLIILGVQFLLSAIHEDLRNVPLRPVSTGHAWRSLSETVDQQETLDARDSLDRQGEPHTSVIGEFDVVLERSPAFWKSRTSVAARRPTS